MGIPPPRGRRCHPTAQPFPSRHAPRRGHRSSAAPTRLFETDRDQSSRARRRCRARQTRRPDRRRTVSRIPGPRQFVWQPLHDDVTLQSLAGKRREGATDGSDTMTAARRVPGSTRRSIDVTRASTMAPPLMKAREPNRCAGGDANGILHLDAQAGVEQADRADAGDCPARAHECARRGRQVVDDARGRTFSTTVAPIVSRCKLALASAAVAAAPPAAATSASEARPSARRRWNRSSSAVATRASRASRSSSRRVVGLAARSRSTVPPLQLHQR